MLLYKGFAYIEQSRHEKHCILSLPGNIQALCVTASALCKAVHILWFETLCSRVQNLESILLDCGCITKSGRLI